MREDPHEFLEGAFSRFGATRCQSKPSAADGLPLSRTERRRVQAGRSIRYFHERFQEVKLESFQP
jgi:hypothetical protein